LRDRGVPVITVDTDGNCWKLLPLFIEGGVTALLPFEAQAGMDVVEVRKAFPRLGILGGMNKRKFALGRDAIDEEVDGKVPFMLKHGAFVPSGDHQVPPDVPWENFKYYRQKLNALILGA
jgi:uroporphyrinogen decarboxylase